jgi:hypothetical protein
LLTKHHHHQGIIESNIVLKNENDFQNEKNSKDIFIKKSLLDIEVIHVKQQRKTSSMDSYDNNNNNDNNKNDNNSNNNNKNNKTVIICL